MPNGVTVISKEEIIERRFKIRLWFSIFLFMWGIAYLFLFLFLAFQTKFFGAFAATMFLGALFLILACPFTDFFIEQVSTGKYRYIVTLDASASFVELTRAYDVEELEDGTYSLEEISNF